MSDSSSNDVFISYASADLQFAEEVHRRLADAGFKVWFDKARLRPGCDWHKEIEAGCEASRVVLPVLTPRWKVSEWTKFETYGAEAVIPLIFEGAFEDIFTPPLTRFQGQAIDLTQADEAAWKRLLAAIRELLARPAPDKLARLAEVRYAANPYFVGREADLNRIHEALHENPTAVLTQGRVRAITALGGIGKTTLARQYIEKFWRCYPQIFWADCRLGVETEFARLCELLFPETRAETNVGQKAQLALRELQTRSDRLLILDNAEDEASIQAWIPKTGHCRTLITSRFAGWSATVKSFHLYVLEPEPARTLLTTRAGRGDFAHLAPAEQTACEALAQELGYLPLALEQAAAYIEQQGTEFTFADYLQLYGEATAELLDAGILGSTEYPQSVMATWTVTQERLDPTPKAILRLCAFLAPTPLPLTVLTGDSQILLDESAAVSGSLAPSPIHIEAWVRENVKQLRVYSMIEGDGHSIVMHPLVQVVERLQMLDSAAVSKTIERSVQLMNRAITLNPLDTRNWPVITSLAPHAITVAKHALNHKILGQSCQLVDKLNRFSDSQELYIEAFDMLNDYLSRYWWFYLLNRRRYASSLIHLGRLLLASGKLDIAENAIRSAISIHERCHGSSHSVVAHDLILLSELLVTAKRHNEAESLIQRAKTFGQVDYISGTPDARCLIHELVRDLDCDRIEITLWINRASSVLSFLFTIGLYFAFRAFTW